MPTTYICCLRCFVWLSAIKSSVIILCFCHFYLTWCKGLYELLSLLCICRRLSSVCCTKLQSSLLIPQSQMEPYYGGMFFEKRRIQFCTLDETSLGGIIMEHKRRKLKKILRTKSSEEPTVEMLQYLLCFVVIIIIYIIVMCSLKLYTNKCHRV